MRTRALTARIALGLAAAIVLVTAGCGERGLGDPSADSEGARRVEVAMVDIGFEPGTLEVAKGERVHFTFINDGKVRHEAYFGTVEAQADHEKEMVGAGEDSGGHGAHAGNGNSKRRVDPGESGELTYLFDEAGILEIGCHEPGHYAGGMKITVKVT